MLGNLPRPSEKKARQDMRPLVFQQSGWFCCRFLRTGEATECLGPTMARIGNGVSSNGKIGGAVDRADNRYVRLQLREN
ncbi:hypothetical protein [Nisaea sp.]|uniref:hypothetical protein n=1 Tax=Nisaea sp. TaxID=2024842 RepID=UPI0032670D7E